MTNANEFTRKVRIGRKVQVQNLWSIWIDNDDLVCVAQFWLDEYGCYDNHPEVIAAKADYGSIYSVRLASRGEPR